MGKFVMRIAVALCLAFAFNSWGADITPMPLGADAPEFSLPGVDGKMHSLSNYADAEVLAIVFTCNHCPTAQAYEERIQALHDDYKDKGVAVLAVSPNDPLAIRLDELGYTDVSDSFEDMKIRAEHRDFTFPYLYDGETQDMSKAYGPVATPHVFVFDADRKLRYEGRFDDRDNPAEVTSHDTRNAIDALLAGKDVPVAQTKVRGCSVKWSDKRDTVKESQERWANQPVEVKDIDIDGLKALVKNDSDKLRMINVWATWCGPCVAEFPDLVEIHRMYGHREFELVTVSSDNSENADGVKKFLESHEASMTNYHYKGDDPYAMIEAVDPDWRGAIPYTLIVKPGGEVIYRKMGAIDPLEVKRAIVDVIGRTYF